MDGSLQRPVHFIVDHREARSGVVSALEAMDAVTLEFGHLSVGDYQVEGVIVFERKGLPDLAASIKDGRLFRQAAALAALSAPAHGAPTRGALILEGAAGDLAGSAMRREAIQGALITVTLFYGVPLLRSMSCEETARIMVYAGRQARSFQVGALPRKGRRPKGKRKAQLMMLQGLPGVGPARAERLLERFGSVEAVLGAATDELAEIDGIGEHTANRIRWLVSQPEPPRYGC